MKSQKFLLFTVAGLTILTVLAVLFSNLFEMGDINFRKWGLAAVLAEIVGLFVLIVKMSFKSRQINVFLAMPDELKEYTNSINWDSNSCYIVLSGKKEKVKLTKSDVGPGFKVYFNQDLLGQIFESEILEFELMELNGNKWRVGPFNLNDFTRNLEFLEKDISIVNYD